MYLPPHLNAGMAGGPDAGCPFIVVELEVIFMPEGAVHPAETGPVHRVHH